MRVGLNLIYLVPGESGGTETYARELIPAMVAAAPQIQFTAFVSRETSSSSLAWIDLMPVVTVPVRARNRTQWVRGEQQLLPGLAATAGIDLLHSLANTGPATGRFRRIVTIHDLHFRLVPEAHLGRMALGMRVLVPLAARRSDRVIVPAASTGRDLRNLVGIDPGKIDVVPEGVGAGRRAEPLQAPELRRTLGIADRPIVLCVAAKRPHKNLVRLIFALALIPTEDRPVLVIPGYPTKHEEELRELVSDLGLANDVRLLGWVEPSELEGLYAAAACLVCPSLHEGFGLPVLEAMARGVPVACSARGALAEVAGNAALRFDPGSPREIATAIQTLLRDPDEARRLRAAGIEQARRFTWEAAAAGTLASYARAVGTISDRDHSRPYASTAIASDPSNDNPGAFRANH